MKFKGTYKKWLFREQTEEIDTTAQSVCVVNRKDSKATGYLMHGAIEQGCSVIFYGRDTDYYQYVFDIAPTYVSVIDYNTLIDRGEIPYIKNSCDKALEQIGKCYSDYALESRFLYLKNRRKGEQFEDPNTYQCFYQIKDGNIEKEKVVTESFLVNIIAQALYKDPLHEVILFLDMPYRPITLTMFDALHKIKETTNMSLISLYKESENDGQMVVVSSDGNKITFTSRNKEFLIANG